MSSYKLQSDCATTASLLLPRYSCSVRQGDSIILVVMQSQARTTISNVARFDLEAGNSRHALLESDRPQAEQQESEI